MSELASAPADTRPYSPGLEGVIAGETALSYIDGEAGRLLYRGYSIGELVHKGSYAAIAELLWTGEWKPDATLPCLPVSDAVLTALRALPADARPMDALRTAVSVWGAVANPSWPPTPEQARELTASSPSALAAFARLRQGLEPVAPDPDLDLVAGFLYQLNGEKPEAEAARALDAYFVVGAEHGFNASTFTARVITSTRSDIASAVCGAIGALKGPLHGGAPSEVVEQIHQVGSPERAEAWVREVAMDMEHKPEWLELAIAVEDVALRVLAEKHPDRALKTNVEFYAAPVLMGAGLKPDLFPAAFALASQAGWTAHAIEQGANNRLIRPDVKYVGPGSRPLAEA